MLNLNKRVIIEYFGDYWHCNPNIYSPTFYNKNLKRTAQEQWLYDKIRLEKILARDTRINTIIIVWESVFNMYNLNELVQKLETIINERLTSTTKEILWI